MTLCCAFVVVLFSTATVVAQTVILDNHNRPISLPFYDDRGFLLTGSNYLAQIYAGHTPDLLRSYGISLPFRTGTNAGFIQPAGMATYITLTGFNPCRGAWVQVRSWETAGGGSFEAAAAKGAWTGMSSIIWIDLLGGCLGGAGPTVPAALLGLQYPGAPLIVFDPAGYQARITESLPPLRVVASGAITLSYQWFRGRSGETNSPIPGATNAFYTPEPVLGTSYYWARAQTAVGSVDSKEAVVTIYPGDSIVLEIGRGTPSPVLRVHAPAGAYELLSTTNLANPNWAAVTNLTLTSSPVEVAVGETNAAARFYRVRGRN